MGENVPKMVVNFKIGLGITFRLAIVSIWGGGGFVAVSGMVQLSSSSLPAGTPACPGGSTASVPPASPHCPYLYPFNGALMSRRRGIS